MKKTVAALAVLTVIAGAAHAQSSVSLYGLVDVFVGESTSKITIGSAVAKSEPGTSLTSGGLNGSRWGLRGSEDLGGGLKASFQLEQGFSADTGAAAATVGFNRTSKVGLSGAFGSIEMGRQYTHLFQLVDGFDAQGSSSFSATNAIFGPAVLSGVVLAPTLRRDNMVQYTSPDMGGFTAGVQYAFGENGAVGVSAGRAVSVAAGYVNGPIAVQGVYEAVKGAGAAAATAKSTGLGVSYDFTAVKVLAQFVTQKDGLANGSKDNGYVLSAIVPVGSSGSVNVGLGGEKSKDVLTGIQFAKTTSASVEYRHNLSKRTTVYAGLTNLKFELDSTPVATVKDQRYGVGIRHKF